MKCSKQTIGILVGALISVGLLGCSSGDSITDPGDRSAADTTPPAVPDGLRIDEFADMVRVRWEPNTVDADLVGFMVYRSISGSEILTTEPPVADTAWVDVNPPTQSCTYAVTSIDVAGNESARRTVAYQPEGSSTDRLALDSGDRP